MDADLAGRSAWRRRRCKASALTRWTPCVFG